MSKYLGNVSAYAYAVEHGGYTGTEEEYGQEMADLANISAEAETLPPESEATASYSHGVMSFGIPKGPGPTETQIRSAVDSWLADHPEATTTVDFSIATKVFNTVSAMQADLTLKANDNVCTKGYYEDGDNGGSNYQVSSTHSGVFYVELENGLYANRIDEGGVLKAEAIGIKAYSAETETPDQDDMDTNVLLANRAIYNGIRIVFGQGYFYFSDCIRLARKNTYTLRGIDRNLSHLVFPSSDGLYFCDPIYYNYYVVTGLNIHSYGHCIRCAEDCLTVLDSHFEWLVLTSDTGDCFHAPNYNVAKYVTQGGTTVYDTCVQNCVFDFVNASAPNGAAFCNIMGMFTYYMHMNLVSCKYGFRNCDGAIIQLNTLGQQEDYFIYYDKANSFSLRWTFVDVNAEGLKYAFIYSEPIANAGAGEDTRKPETANLMGIAKLTAINSGWSLRYTENNTYYPITAHSISDVNLINSNTLLVPSAYPEKYDTSVVKAHVLMLRDQLFTCYHGGPDILIAANGGSQIHTAFGDNESRTKLTVNNNGGYASLVLRNDQTFKELTANRIFGGKARNVWDTKASVTTSSQPNPPEEYLFCDVVAFEVDQTNAKAMATLCHQYESSFPGRILTLVNKSASLGKLVLKSANDNRAFNNFALSKDCIKNLELNPGECITLIDVYEENPTNGNMRRAWKPISATWDTDDSWMLEMLETKPANVNLIPFIRGSFIRTGTTTIDVSTAIETGAANNSGTYGFGYILQACSAGDEFTIFHGLGTNAANLYTFIDSSGAKLSYNQGLYGVDKVVITAPANTAYLIVNSGVNTAVFKSN